MVVLSVQVGVPAVANVLKFSVSGVSIAFMLPPFVTANDRGISDEAAPPRHSPTISKAEMMRCLTINRLR